MRRSTRDFIPEGAAIYLDGLRLNGVVAFDSDEGWAENVVFDEHGKAWVNEALDGVQTEILRGVITFEPAEEHWLKIDSPEGVR